MSDLLKSGAAWLAQQMRAHAASAVDYARGPATLSGLLATKGSTTFELTDSSGMLTRVDSVDFSITAADLVLCGVVVLPRRGDIVTDADGVEYTVYPFNGQDCWRWSDPHRYGLRIHTKVTDESAVAPDDTP